LQDTRQSLGPAELSLQIGSHQRTFHYQAGHLQSVSSGSIHQSYDYAPSGFLAKKKTNNSNQTIDYHDTGLPATIKTGLSNQSCLETLNWNNSNKLISYGSSCPQHAGKIAWGYTLRGQLKSSKEGTYEFDFSNPERGIRTEAPGHKVLPQGLDPFGKVNSEWIDGSLHIC
jgi:hypothetical protein